MAIPAWYWPPSGAAARGVALVPFGTGLAVADWTAPQVWPFASGALSAAVALISGTPGLAGAAPDGSGGLWTVSYAGTLWHLASSLAVTGYALPSGSVYVGAAVAAGSGFAATASGSVYASSATVLGTWPTPVIALTGSGSVLAAPLPASGIGTMAAVGGATGLIAFPSAITTPSCLALASGQSVLLGGWQTAPPLSGAAAAVLDPQNAALVLAVGSGQAILWSAPGALSDAWAQTQVLTGLANLSAAAWRPDGTQGLAASLTSGVVQVLGYTGGTLSLLQTLSVSGAVSVAIAGDSLHALVAQSGQAQVATLAYAGSIWSTGVPVTGFPGIAAVVPWGATGAVAAYSGGIAYLSLSSGGVWSPGPTLALGFSPTALAVDPFLQVYAAGSGALAVASGATVLGSGSWSGAAPTAVAVQDGRILLAVPSDGLLRIFAKSAAAAWSQQGSQTLSLGAAVGLALSETTLFTLGSGATETYGFSGTPFALTPVRSGAVGQWNGSAWTTTALGIGHVPSSVAFDASGNAWAVTVQGTLWSISSGGAVLTSGYVPTFSGQPQTTMLGASAVLPASGHVYVATSLSGVLVEAI